MRSLLPTVVCPVREDHLVLYATLPEDGQHLAPHLVTASFLHRPHLTVEDGESLATARLGVDQEEDGFLSIT